MGSIELDSIIYALCRDEPSRHDLKTLYTELRSTSGSSEREIVMKYALLQAIGEMVDYFDMVEQELGKSIGISCQQERHRIFSQFVYPNTGNTIRDSSQLIKQWEAVDKLSIDELPS